MKLQAVAAVIAVATCIMAAEPSSPVAQKRNAERQARAAVLKTLPEAIRKANSQYLTAEAGTCQWLIGLKAKDEAAKIVSDIEKIDEKNQNLASLKKGVEGIASATPLDDAAKKDYASRHKAALKSRATGFAELAKSLYGANLPRQAHDLILQAIEFDPDCAPARQAMGQTKVGEAWVDAFSAGQMQKGLSYLPDYGWVPAAAVERTKKDEWLDNGKWMSLGDADTAHSTVATAWNIETAHFTIKSTGPRKRAVALAERLENFHQVVYREYLEFFMRGEKKPQMSFTHTSAKKMLVHQFGEKKDYDSTLKKDLKNPALQPYLPFLMMLPGFYTPFSHASYFQVGDDNAFQQILTLNMMARQILCEFTQGGIPGPKPWILGGSAEMFEFAKAGDDGKWYVASGRSNQCVITVIELFNNQNIPSLPILLNMEENVYNKEPQNKENNSTAGALCRFFLDAKDGIYSLDFLEFVYDALKNPKTANLADYIGMDAENLEKLFYEFLVRKN